MMVIDGPEVVDKGDLGPHRDADGVLIACETCAHYLIFTPEMMPTLIFEHCQKGHDPCDACDDWERCDTNCDKTACDECALDVLDTSMYVQFICNDCGAGFDAPAGYVNQCPCCTSYNTREM